ncbi:hypothetical protein Saga11_03660 [Bacillus safensis]|nr:hypothetical protein Saga11_03660 [Bacillus safensis]
MPNTIPHLKHSLCQVCNSVLALHREYAKNEDGTRDLSEKAKQKIISRSENFHFTRMDIARKIEKVNLFT